MSLSAGLAETEHEYTRIKVTPLAGALVLKSAASILPIWTMRASRKYIAPGSIITSFMSAGRR